MFKNFIKSSFRSLKKNLGFSLINILGLSVGLACSVLIMVFVWHELSYDKYNVKADRVYRIAQRALVGNTLINQTWTPAPMSAALYKEFPEVEAVTRIDKVSNQTVVYNNRIFIEKRIWLADSSIFDVFSFQFIKGEPKNALNKPNKVVITESIANKYFGNEDPIGKVFKVEDSDGATNYEVTAVIKDVPDNSHFHIDFILSLITNKSWCESQEWFNNGFFTYLALKEGTDRKEFEAKIPAFTNKYLFNGKYEEMRKKHNGYWEVYLQPLLDIHLNSDITGEFEPNGRKSYVYIFFVVAIIILLIACINFMNLNTAKSAGRAREVGVRKVVGARRRSLIFQFMGESIITSIISLGLGMAIVETLLPAYGNLLGRHLEIHYFDNFYVLPLLVSLAIVVGIISGSYPAFFLSSFKPVNVLKGKLKGGAKIPWLRNTLVVVQFTISIILIIGTFLIYKQLQYLQNERLGFDKEEVVVLKNPFALGKNMNVFKEELTSNKEIKDVSYSTSIPGKMFNNIGFQSDGKEGFSLNLISCDYDFAKVMTLELVDGRFFNNSKGDSLAVILNESAVKLLDFKEPIGKTIRNNYRVEATFTVVGVVKDFYFESKHQKIRPMALFNIDGYYNWPPNYISVKVKTSSIKNVIGFIDSKWKKYANSLPLDYTFLNDEYDILYKNERQTQHLFLVYSILAIFIACLGLLGLSSFIAEQRTKEIGVRKVMGASVSKITLLLSSNFTKWVILSNLLAWPLGYYLMSKWLEGFAYRVSISWWMFVVAALISIAIALITISYQSIKAATRNPIESLRYE